MSKFKFKGDFECFGRTLNQRADKAALAVREFTDLDVDDDSITDLIADLLHLCDRSGIKPRIVLRKAVNHWEHERKGKIAL